MKKILCILITEIFILTIPTVAYAAKDIDKLPSGIAYLDIGKSIDQYVAENRKTTAAVSVAVFQRDKIIFKKSYGNVDIENKIVNDSNAVFEWGSCTKLLVWTSLMQLAEQGKIKLNQDIRTYLPKDFFHKLHYDTPITVINLMNHNAGWQETVTDLFIKKKKNVKELGEALRLIEPEQIHKPGTVTAYSNWGAALAGYIVERVSGQSFSDYVHENIFKPLGMKHTALNATLSDNAWVLEKRAKEKCYTAENKTMGTCHYYISLYPAGMATGTFDDFVKFAQAFTPAQGCKSALFHNKKTLNEMLSPTSYYADKKTGRNCHGFWTDEMGVNVLWHNGGTVGSSSWFAFDPVTGTGMVILTNQSEESVYNCGLLPFVFGKNQCKKVTEKSDDISGLYMSSRTCFKGFAKPYSLACLMQISSDKKGSYTIPGTNNTIHGIGAGSYLMDMGRKQFLMQADQGSNGKVLLQIPGQDYIKISGTGVIAELVLLILFMLSALYSLIMLLKGLVKFILHKNKKQPFSGYRHLVHFAVVCSFVIAGYITVALSSNLALISEVRWSIILNAVLALISVFYAIILAVKLRYLKCPKKDKFKLILTGVAGLIMTSNVVFWNGYKFW